MNRICVFCGSRFGVDTKYSDAASNLGRLLVSNGFGLVYGGAKVGLMGVIADAVLEEDGEVIGVMPKDIVEKEIAHNGLTELKIVDTMHERKAEMIRLADGFIALPGGMGTLDEFCEVITWTQLGYHNKPCGLLNTGNYFEHFIEFFKNAVSQKFIKQEHRSLILIDDNPATLLQKMMMF
ncbi:MAG: TIGR00730 family Rossman fold protein [Ignavibacteria bacterium]|nr:TIGR00730 family Rossman fold protein [Ignavibacteria bacterium]